MNTQSIRRRSNGTIDIDFYRAQAVSEHAALMTNTCRSIHRTARTIIASVGRIVRAASRPRPLPDPSAMMLIAQGAIKRPPI